MRPISCYGGNLVTVWSTRLAILLVTLQDLGL